MMYEAALIVIGLTVGAGTTLAFLRWGSCSSTLCGPKSIKPRNDEELERYRRSQVFANIGTWDWDMQKDELFWSDEIYTMFGYRPGQVQPSYEHFSNAVHPDDRALVKQAEDACIAGHANHDVEYRVVWPDGSIRWLRETGDVLFNDKNEAIRFTGIVRDITESKLQADRVEHLAHHDQLTGLPNRELFRTHLMDAMQRADRHDKMVALVFMDLNKFKPINDAFGHTTGDKVLQALAQRLRHAVRNVDFVARVGGDEFIAILEDIQSENEVRGVIEKIRTSFVAPLHLEDHSHVVGVSIGVSLYPQDAKDTEELIHIADMAMYQAKRYGENAYKFGSRAKPEGLPPYSVH